MQKNCVIFCSLPTSENMLRMVPRNAFVIAADAGWKQAEKLGVTPQLVVGDFDSAPPPAHAVELLHLPAEKDETDTFFAVRQALQRGYKNILLLGALGGRADHTYANLQTLLYATKQGASMVMANEETRVYCAPAGCLCLPAEKNMYLSVFAAEGTVRGVCLRGVKYPLHNAVLTPDYPLGVSNEFAASQAEISCKEGYLFVMLNKKDNDE